MSIDRSGLFGAVAFFGALAGFWLFLQLIAPEPRERWGEVDPDISRDLAALEAWDGRCRLADPETRAQIEAGARVFDADAVACLVPADLFEGGWERRSQDEKAELLELLGAHYVLSGDERLLDLEICSIEPILREPVFYDIGLKMRQVSIQPMRYALEQPDPLERGDALRRFFDCPEWTLEQRLNALD